MIGLTFVTTGNLVGDSVYNVVLLSLYCYVIILGFKVTNSRSIIRIRIFLTGTSPLFLFSVFVPELCEL